MRVSTSGELVKSEVGQVPLRRSGRLWGPARRSAASASRDLRLVTALLGLAAVLIAAQPLGAAAAPGPDPHPSATQPTGARTPDPAPPSRQRAPTPGSAEAPNVSSSADEPATEPSSPPRTSVERPRATKPAPRPRPSSMPKSKSRTKPAVAPAKEPATLARGGGGNESARVAARSTAAVSAAKSTTDPMVLGAFALLTLALSSAGLLLVLHRSERSEARA